MDDPNKHERIQRRQAQKKRQKRNMAIWLGICCLVIIASLGVVLFLQFLPSPTPGPVTQPPSTTQPPLKPDTVIHLAFGGDLNVTDRTVAAGSNGAGYDYAPVFKDVAHVLAGADAAVLNFEGNLCGAPYGSTDTRAPIELAQALKDAGVDLVQMANSCSINNGVGGLQSTLDNLRLVGLTPVGAYATNQEAQAARRFTLMDVKGVKVAFVAFTKGIGNLALPAGSEDCVNLLYTDYTSTYQKINTDGITQVLQDVAREQPDVTIALLHWGSEFNSQLSKSQTQIVELMQANGVDAIVGSHSHYVQTADYDAENGKVVAYSLGDFFGDADKSGTDYSLILDLQITKNNNTGECKITGMDFTPIYTVTPEKDGVPHARVLRIEAAMAHYEANGLDKVSKKTYDAMKSALSKVESRIPRG